MAFIRARNLRRDESGAIVGGSASLVESKYDPTVPSGHSRQVVLENLGRIVTLSEDRKSGVFVSPTRGIIAYDARTGELEALAPDDPRCAGVTDVPEISTYLVFGNGYLFTALLKKRGWLRVLRVAAPDATAYERLLAHTTHAFLRNGSGIKCDTFIAHTALSALLQPKVVSSLRRHSLLYDAMGSDDARQRLEEACRKYLRLSPGANMGSPEAYRRLDIRDRGWFLTEKIYEMVEADLQTMPVPTDEVNTLHDMFDEAASLYCGITGTHIRPERPRKETLEVFQMFGVTLPLALELDQWKKDLLLE